MRYNWMILIVLTLIIGTSCVTTDDKPTTIDSVKINEDLRRAAEYGNIDKIWTLLDAGAEVNATNDDGVTALMWASVKGHPKVAQMLIEKGADVNVKGKEGATALIAASKYGHLDIATLLIEAGFHETDIRVPWLGGKRLQLIFG